MKKLIVIVICLLFTTCNRMVGPPLDVVMAFYTNAVVEANNNYLEFYRLVHEGTKEETKAYITVILQREAEMCNKSVELFKKKKIDQIVIDKLSRQCRKTSAYLERYK